MIYRGLFLVVAFSFFALNAYASETNGTIDATYKYAWSSVSGWVNFGLSSGNIHITNATVTGYAWLANHGWLKFDPSNGGVLNDGAGNLSGSAWGEQTGWISFSGVTIDSAGKFHGMATYQQSLQGATGQITFDCTNCDVRTDWRSTSNQSAGSGGGGGLLLERIQPRSTPSTTTSPITPFVSSIAPPTPTSIPPSSSSRTFVNITKHLKQQLLGRLSCPRYFEEAFGEQGERNKILVEKLQKFLVEYEGFSKFVNIGVYDTTTRDAVKRFQQRNKYVETGKTLGTGTSSGIIDSVTVNLINERVCEVARLNREIRQEQQLQAEIQASNSTTTGISTSTATTTENNYELRRAELVYKIHSIKIVVRNLFELIQVKTVSVWQSIKNTIHQFVYGK